MTPTNPFRVDAMPAGEVRVSATLFPEEIRHGAVVRGFSVAEARGLAAQLLAAAEVAEAHQ